MTKQIYQVFSVTRQGQYNEVNQDRVLTDSAVVAGHSAALIAVADGMGGHQHGEVAAQMAIDCVREWWDGFRQAVQLPPGAAIDTQLDEVFDRAYRRIDDYNLQNGGNAGTTLVLCLCLGQNFVIKNVGDSRCYAWQAEPGLTLLSVDDSWVQEQLRKKILSEHEAKTHPRRNILTRCLGLGRYFGPHTCWEALLPQQVLLVCSDGFFDQLYDVEMEAAVQFWQDSGRDPLATVLPLLLEREAHDDISIALCRAVAAES